MKNRAIPMEAYAVFQSGQLKGIFGKESYAKLKQQQLISLGTPSEIESIEPIEINNFKGLE